MWHLILLAMLAGSAASSTHHLDLFGGNSTHPGLFGRNHTHLLQLLDPKLSHQLELFGHELRSHHEQHDKSRSPGWLQNILNPLVRAAFPEANAYYLAHYASNVTFDGPGRNHSHPMDPSYKIPTIKPPPKRRVPEYNPGFDATLAPLQENPNPDAPSQEISTNTSDPLSQQDPGPAATPQNTSTNTSGPFPTELQSRPGLPQEMLQAASKSSLTSGQQLQQVSHQMPSLSLHNFSGYPISSPRIRGTT